MDPQNYVIYFSISDVIGQTVEVLNKASFYLRYVYWSDQFEILELLISGDDEKVWLERVTHVITRPLPALRFPFRPLFYRKSLSFQLCAPLL